MVIRPCCVCKRKKADYPNLKLHHFPKDERRCIEWLKILDLPHLEKKSLKQLNNHYVVCCLHFNEDQFHHSGRIMYSAYPMGDGEERDYASLPQVNTPDLSTPQDSPQEAESDSCLESGDDISLDTDQLYFSLLNEGNSAALPKQRAMVTFPEMPQLVLSQELNEEVKDKPLMNSVTFGLEDIQVLDVEDSNNEQIQESNSSELIDPIQAEETQLVSSAVGDLNNEPLEETTHEKSADLTLPAEEIETEASQQPSGSNCGLEDSQKLSESGCRMEESRPLSESNNRAESQQPSESNNVVEDGQQQSKSSDVVEESQQPSESNNVVEDGQQPSKSSNVAEDIQQSSESNTRVEESQQSSETNCSKEEDQQPSESNCRADQSQQPSESNITVESSQQPSELNCGLENSLQPPGHISPDIDSPIDNDESSGIIDVDLLEVKEEPLDFNDTDDDDEDDSDDNDSNDDENEITVEDDPLRIDDEALVDRKPITFNQMSPVVEHPNTSSSAKQASTKRNTKSKAKAPPKGKLNGCNKCASKPRLDGHRECSAHGPCTKLKHFDPMACPVCAPHVQALLQADVINKRSRHWRMLKERLNVGRRWALRKQTRMTWLDEKLGMKLGLATTRGKNGALYIRNPDAKGKTPKKRQKKCEPLSASGEVSSEFDSDITCPIPVPSSRAKKTKAKSSKRCSLCSIPIGDDGHRRCSAHAPCTRQGVFDPLACDICSLHVKALLNAKGIESCSESWTVLRNRLTNAQKWASRKGITFRWANDQLRLKFYLMRDSLFSKNLALKSDPSSPPPPSPPKEEKPTSQEKFMDMVYQYVNQILEEKKNQDQTETSKPSKTKRGRETDSPTCPPSKKKKITSRTSSPMTSAPGWEIPTDDQSVRDQSELSGDPLSGTWFPVPPHWNVSMVAGKLVATESFVNDKGVLSRQPINNVEFQITQESGHSVMKFRYALAANNPSNPHWTDAPNRLRQALAQADQLFPGKHPSVIVTPSPTSNGLDVKFLQEPSPVLKSLGDEFLELWNSTGTKMVLPPSFTGKTHCKGSSTYADALRFLSAPEIHMGDVPSHLRRARSHYLEADGRNRQSALALASVQTSLVYGSEFAGRMAERLTSEPQLDAGTVIRLLQEQMLSAAQSLTFHIKDLLKQAIQSRMCVRRDTLPKVPEKCQQSLLKGDPFEEDIFKESSLRPAMNAAGPKSKRSLN